MQKACRCGGRTFNNWAEYEYQKTIITAESRSCEEYNRRMAELIARFGL